MSTAPVSTPVPPSRHLSISQPDILLDLHAVLRDATLSVALEEYLMAEFSVENLHFYQAVAEFRVCEVLKSFVNGIYIFFSMLKLFQFPNAEM